LQKDNNIRERYCLESRIFFHSIKHDAKSSIRNGRTEDFYHLFLPGFRNNLESLCFRALISLEEKIVVEFWCMKLSRYYILSTIRRLLQKKDEYYGYSDWIKMIIGITEWANL